MNTLPSITRFSSPGSTPIGFLSVAGLLSLSALAARAMDFYVSSAVDGGSIVAGLGSGNSGNLRYCLNEANKNPYSTIHISPDFTTVIQAPMPILKAAMTIRSTSATLRPVIDGAGTYRLFFVDAPGAQITLQMLTLRNAVAKGGRGASGAGGGLGAGGALFVNAGSVTAEKVVFQDNQAIGGIGGLAFNESAGESGGGGGGGLGGEGGYCPFTNFAGPPPPEGNSEFGGGGGGGYWGAGGQGYLQGGGGGGIYGHGGSGIAEHGRQAGGGGGVENTIRFANSPVQGWTEWRGAVGGGGNGHRLVQRQLITVPGQPIITESVEPAVNGEYGGGGGGGGYEDWATNYSSGANGGKFGGGGGGPGRRVNTRGGDGGEFGGGGGGYTQGGNGGWGGGGGSSLGWADGVPGNSGYGAGGAGARKIENRRSAGRFGGAGGWGKQTNQIVGWIVGPGGGGAGLGGAVFVRQTTAQQEARFEAVDCGFTGNSVTPGTAGQNSPSSNPHAQSLPAADGLAFGSHLFFGQNLTLNYSTDTVFPGPLESDDSDNPGARHFTKAGAGFLTVASLPGFTGKVSVTGGTLRILAGTLGHSDNTLNVAGGTFDLYGMPCSIGGLTGTGLITNNSSASATLTAGNGVTGEFFMDGRITDGPGPVALTKVGASHQYLDSANTYSGPTLVTGTGALVLNTTGAAVPVIPAASTLTVDGSLVKTVGNEYNALLGSPVILKNGGTLSAEGTQKNSHNIGALTFSNGGRLLGYTPDPAYGNFVLSGPVASNGNSQALIDAAEIELRDNIIFSVDDGPQETDLLISAKIRNVNFDALPGALTKTGAGTLRLTAENSFSGGTAVNGGTLRVTAPNSPYGALGRGNVTVTGGRIVAEGDNSLVGYNTVAAPPRVFSLGEGTIVESKGTTSCHLFHLLMDGGELVAEQPNTSYGNWNFDGGVSVPEYGVFGVIRGGNATLSQPGGTVFNIGANAILSVETVLDHLFADTGLVKTGAGLLQLKGNNRYTGTTVLNGGVVSLWHENALGNGGPVTFAGGELAFANGVAPDISARINPVAAGQTINISGGDQSVNFASALKGAGGLSWRSAPGGKLHLAAAPQFTGPVSVLGGTLSIALAGLADGASVTVAAGAVLQLPFTGTDTVQKLFLGGVEQHPGVYKASGNPAPGTATNFLSGTGTLTVLTGTPLTDFETWANANGLTGGPGDDDDGDGLTNRDEYAFGLLPLSAGSRNPFVSSVDPVTGQFTYTRRTASLTGLAYSVRVSSDLASWAIPPGTTQTVTGTSPGLEMVQVTLPAELLTGSRLYVQVRAE